MYTITSSNEERLRDDLMDHFGTAAFGPFPMAMVDLTIVQSADAQKLVDIAIREGFNIFGYVDYVEDEENPEEY